jgi:hypothetical protein
MKNKVVFITHSGTTHITEAEAAAGDPYQWEGHEHQDETEEIAEPW